MAIVPAGLAIALITLSLLIGWNTATLTLFWFVLTPLLAIYLPALVSKHEGQMFESLAGLTIFYGAMVFMIYKHYNTDYFKVMVVSFIINVVLVAAVALIKKRRAQI